MILIICSWGWGGGGRKWSGLVPARGKSADLWIFADHKTQTWGGEDPDSVFSLGHTVGRYFTRQQLTHGVADHGGKLEAINIPAKAVVESTLLFDCSVRAWTPTDIQKFQSVADRAYRFVWNNGKPLTLIRMQNEGVNSYEIRRQLNIESIRTKIECRALEWMGHVLRMSDERIVKKAVLGSWDMERTRSGNSRGNTIQ